MLLLIFCGNSRSTYLTRTKFQISNLCEKYVQFFFCFWLWMMSKTADMSNIVISGEHLWQRSNQSEANWLKVMGKAVKMALVLEASF